MATNVGGGCVGGRRVWARKTHLRMSPAPLQSQEENAKHYNGVSAIRVRHGKPLDKGSLESYQRKDLGKAADELRPPPIWGKVKNDPPPPCLPKNCEGFFPI